MFVLLCCVVVLLLCCLVVLPFGRFVVVLVCVFDYFGCVEVVLV